MDTLTHPATRDNPGGTDAASATDAPPGQRRPGLAALTLGAVGVVYGDIGTSPLYTMREVFAPGTGIVLDPAHLVGAVSVIVWALVLVVTLKYVVLILRADNHGEGGGLALTALAANAVPSRPRLRLAVLMLGAFGAALFYGDSIITPAISVLGAVEGLKVLAPALESWVVPASAAIVAGLFALQRFGTATVGRCFGPVIVLWFLTLAGVGIVHIAQQPGILAALNPAEAVHFLAGRGAHLLPAVGAIVLALTGAEALYADMGHFGRRPVRLAWSTLVFPALALNYMGQGALLIGQPAAIENPFYRLFPEAALLPALVLATLAAIIASQAVISGAYSMTRQAIQLGLLPRMAVRFTSAHEAGQIYMPRVNLLLLAGVLAATVGFGSSSALAGAYGIAVTLTMAITTLLAGVVVRGAWRLPLPLALAATALFLAIDLLLVAGCAVKLLDGGWFPLALGLLLFGVMATWWSGRARLLGHIRREGVPLPAFLDGLDPQLLQSAQRTAVYLVADPSTVPQALLHNLKHYQVLHACNVVATVVFREVPWVPASGRLEVHALGKGFWSVALHFGFMETPDVPRALALAAARGLPIPAFETTYFLSRETVVPPREGGIAALPLRLFAAMSRQSSGVAGYFRLPDNAVVELGTRVPL